MSSESDPGPAALPGGGPPIRPTTRETVTLRVDRIRAIDHRDALTDFVEADATTRREAAIALSLRGRFEAAIEQLHEMERDDAEITLVFDVEDVLYLVNAHVAAATHHREHHRNKTATHFEILASVLLRIISLQAPAAFARVGRLS